MTDLSIDQPEFSTDAMPWTLETLNDYIEPVYSEFYSFILREFYFSIPTLSKLEIEFLANEFNKQATNSSSLIMNDLEEIFNNFMDPIWIPSEGMPVEGIVDEIGREKKETRRNFLVEYSSWRATEENKEDSSSCSA
jgi:hypothetical protein